MSSSMTAPSSGSPAASTRVPLIEPPAMSMVLTSGVPTRGMLNPSSMSMRVPSSKITVTSYSPGTASTMWNVPGCTIGPLNIPSPSAEESVPLMVPYESRSSEALTVNSPEPTRVAWLRLLTNAVEPFEVKRPVAFMVPSSR